LLSRQSVHQLLNSDGLLERASAITALRRARVVEDNCAPERADTILATIVDASYPFARIIVSAEAGTQQVRIGS
jgi:hypothetical protein